MKSSFSNKIEWSGAKKRGRKSLRAENPTRRAQNRRPKLTPSHAADPLRFANPFSPLPARRRRRRPEARRRMGQALRRSSGRVRPPTPAPSPPARPPPPPPPRAPPAAAGGAPTNGGKAASASPGFSPPALALLAALLYRATAQRPASGPPIFPRFLVHWARISFG